MYTVPFALLVALLCGIGIAAIIGGITKQRKRAATAGVPALIVAFGLIWLCRYVFLIAETGFLGGYWYVPVTIAISFVVGAIIDYLINDESYYGEAPLVAKVVGGGFVYLVLQLVLYVATGAYFYLGSTNHKLQAQQGNIEVADEKFHDALPDTDPNEVLSMNPDTAFNRAHTAIGEAKGNNLGSRYVINREDAVQQTIAGRNYVVFPLELNGWMEQCGFLSEKVDFGAGFIAVPTSGINQPVKIVDDLHLKYLPGSYFDRNLMRYLYQKGYNHGVLKEATIEIRDDWHVFFTVTYVSLPFVVGGQKAEKTLVVDPANGHIDEYAVDNTPEWVDRVISGDMVDEYVNGYGLYHEVTDFFNSSGNSQMKADQRVLLYSTAKHTVWMVTMTSNTNTNSSSTGVILYDTRRQKGKFYSGVSGLALQHTLTGSFLKPQGLTQQYDVDSIQFYRIHNVKTWVAIYTVDHGDAGKTFAGMGFLDAEFPNATDVRFGTTREAALENYYTYLNTRGSTAPDPISEKVNKQTITAKIYRIGAAQQNGLYSYIVVLNGDERTFIVPASSYKRLPIVQSGDEVTLTFEEPDKKTDRTDTRQVASFVDDTIESAMRQAPR